jgi:ferritin-like metal-binding protein YciE
VLEAEGPGPVIDAALIAAAQRVEHYEISAYGSARALATHLGHDNVADLLQETLDEESAADEKLTSISEEEILPNAAGVEDVAAGR